MKSCELSSVHIGPPGLTLDSPNLQFILLYVGPYYCVEYYLLLHQLCDTGNNTQVLPSALQLKDNLGDF